MACGRCGGAGFFVPRVLDAPPRATHCDVQKSPSACCWSLLPKPQPSARHRREPAACSNRGRLWTWGSRRRRSGATNGCGTHQPQLQLGANMHDVCPGLAGWLESLSSSGAGGHATLGGAVEVLAECELPTGRAREAVQRPARLHVMSARMLPAKGRCVAASWRQPAAGWRLGQHVSFFWGSAPRGSVGLAQCSSQGYGCHGCIYNQTIIPMCAVCCAVQTARGSVAPPPTPAAWAA